MDNIGLNPSGRDNIQHSTVSHYHKDFKLGRVLKYLGISLLIIGAIGLVISLVVSGGVFTPFVASAIVAITGGLVTLVPSLLLLKSKVSKGDLHEFYLQNKAHLIASQVIAAEQIRNTSRVASEILDAQEVDFELILHPLPPKTGRYSPQTNPDLPSKSDSSVEITEGIVEMVDDQDTVKASPVTIDEFSKLLSTVNLEVGSTQVEFFLNQLTYSLFKLYDLGLFASCRDTKGSFDIHLAVKVLNSLTPEGCLQLVSSANFVHSVVIDNMLDLKPLTSIFLAKIAGLTPEEKTKKNLASLGARVRDAYGPLIVGKNHFLEMLLQCGTDLTVRLGPLGSAWDYILQYGNLDLLGKMMRYDRYLSCCDDKGQTVITSVLENGKWEYLNYILNNGGSSALDLPNKAGQYPLEILLMPTEQNKEDDQKVIRGILDLSHAETAEHPLSKNGMLSMAEECGLSIAIQDTLRSIGCQD